MATEPATVRVLFDASRLLARGAQATPTGIDRVDLAYVTALSEAPGIELQLVTLDVFGPRMLAQRPATRLVEDIRRRWRAPPAAAASPAFEQVRRWLETPAGGAAPPQRLPAPAKQASRGSSNGWLMLNQSLGLLRLHDAPTNGVPRVYVNTSHGRLFRRTVSRWLERRGIGGVFFVHDLIPLEFPEFNRPKEPARHALRLETVAAHASQIIVNSEATRVALLGHLRRHGQPTPPVEVLHLGVENRFNRAASEPAPGPWSLKPATPYFVALGTVEPRKNHMLLLQVWQRLVESLGDRAPRLVLIGRRGWENQTVFNILDRAASLAPFVIESSSLGDQDVAALLRGARALLAPSFGEGFGLPVAEALALGTPVIASSIPAHREVGGGYAEYLDPLDGTGWQQAILCLALESPDLRERRLQALAAYQPPGWDQHLSSALKLIRNAAGVAARPLASLTSMPP